MFILICIQILMYALTYKDVTLTYLHILIYVVAIKWFFINHTISNVCFANKEDSYICIHVIFQQSV